MVFGLSSPPKFLHYYPDNLEYKMSPQRLWEIAERGYVMKIRFSAKI